MPVVYAISCVDTRACMRQDATGENARSSLGVMVFFRWRNSVPGEI